MKRWSQWNLLAGVLAATTFLQAAAYAAETPEPVSVFRGVPHDMLYGVSMEGPHGIAVGDFGLVVETRDGGRSWSRQAAAATSQGLFAVVRKAGRCIAVGQQGLVLTADDCAAWKSAVPATEERLLAVDANASGTAYAVGGFGTVLKSSDWGRTWQRVEMDWSAVNSDGAEPHLYDVHVADSGEVTIAGEFESVLRSADGGGHWSVLHSGKRSLFALEILADGALYAVGQEGLILKSGDGGRSWAELDAGTSAILTGVCALPDGRVVVAGLNTILHSGDGGASWERDASRPARTGWHEAVIGREDGEGQYTVLVVGSEGAILSVQR